MGETGILGEITSMHKRIEISVSELHWYILEDKTISNIHIFKPLIEYNRNSGHSQIKFPKVFCTEVRTN